MDCTSPTVLPGVSLARAQEWCNLGNSLRLDSFDPTTVNWDSPVLWKADASDGGGAIMSEGAGYAIELGFGAFFSFLTIFLTYLEGKFGGVDITSEHFNTAGRNVKTGLTASVIVSQWTWAATLLQSSNVAWQYGITGPYWYAAGASIQVLVFGILAIEIKKKAPNAHTFLELIYVRWGKTAHLTFMYFAIMTNVIVSSMLLLGGSAVMEAAAGIDIRLSGFLIPLGTLFYTYVGGLKATFLASYVHTTIIFVILVMFVTLVYCVEMDCDVTKDQCNSLGSASIVYERLKFMNALPSRSGTTCGRSASWIASLNALDKTSSEYMALADGCDNWQIIEDTAAAWNRTGFHQGPATIGGELNRGGSYLTMMSLDGFLFGIINIVGNFGTVFVDQSYWQSAIAASPASAHKGYLLGGLVWFTIPFALATSLGLAGNALNVALTGADAGAGLVPPAAATVLIGRGGGIAMIIALFMAITSTGSAECIATASLWAYDVYRRYLKPDATGEDILRQTRYGVVVWAFLMFWYNWILWGMGLNLGWVYNFMGIMIGSAVVPVALCLTWSKTSAFAAMAAAWSGNIGAIITWLVTAASLYDEVSVDSTGRLYPQLAGNCVAIGLSLIVCVIISYIAPQNYNFDEMNKSLLLVEKEVRVLGADWESTPEFLDAASKWIWKYGVGYTLFLTIGWPCLAMPWAVFTESIYNLWASVALGWGYLASVVIIFLPVYENWTIISRVLTWNPPTAEEREMMKKTSAVTVEFKDEQVSAA